MALFDALVERHVLDVRDGLVLTPAGRTWFTDLAGAASLEPVGGRPLVRTCLDWTERRHHLGGALGAALRSHLIEHRWISKAARQRAVTITPEGEQALDQLLGVRAQPAAAAGA